MKTFFPYRGYRVVAEKDDDETKNFIDAILSGSIDVVEVYKANNSSYTAKFICNGEKWVIKIPLGRNRKKFVRFFSLFRNSEPFRRYDHMFTLGHLGLNGPSAVLAAEKRSFGMVTDSFLVYKFIDGRRPVHGEEKLVLNALSRLHQIGYTRKDAKPENFLIAGGEVYFVDFKLSNPFFFRNMRINLELAKFLRESLFSIEHLENATKMTPTFRIAVFCDKLLLQLRRWRRRSQKKLLGFFGK